MIDTSLDTTLKALAIDLARPLDMHDSGSAGQLKQSVLQQRVLATYRDQLAGLGESQTMPWMLERLASLEARVMALQMAALHGSVQAASQSTPSTMDGIAVLPASPEAPVDALPDRVLILCDETLTQRGFYDVEHDIDGRSFRWMGPDVESTVFLPRVKAPFEMRLYVYTIFEEASVDQTRVSIDGGEWQPALRDTFGEGVMLRARSNEGSFSDDQRVRIDIDVGINESPLERGQDDTRRLSFAVSRIELVHIDG